MAFSEDLKREWRGLWERAVRHPFVLELGAGSLPMEKFRRYFIQDYLFVSDLARVSGLAVSKAPTLEAARTFDRFLGVLLGAEDALFARAFANMEIEKAAYRSAALLPTTRAFGDYLVRLAHEGSFGEICCALLVTEGVYLDWADRLRAGGARPGVAAYREWIDIHAEETLGPFVEFLRTVVDATPEDAGIRGAMRGCFETALRYEVRFWDMAYNGETWHA